MKAAVVVTDANAVPTDWSPLATMLAAACEEHVILRPAELPVPVPGPQLSLDRSDELSALKAALTWSQGEPILLVAADIASPSAELARYMEYVRAGHDAVVPMLDDEDHQPLFAIYTAACIGGVNSALLSGKFRIAPFLGGLNVRYVATTEVAKFGDAEVILSRGPTP